MNIIKISSDDFVCTLAADTPASMEVEAGSVVEIHCRSACDRKVGPGPVRADTSNPCTGPIGVRGAKPGQALKFEITRVEAESPGYVASDWDGGMQAVEINDGVVDFHGIRIPADGMMGVLGLAPAEGEWQTMDAGPFGGNMDIKDVAAGATVYMPVFQPGGKFIVGDVHAVMGDGEIGGQGLEAAATVTMRVDIEPEPMSDRIYIRRNDCFMTVGWGEKIEDAVKDASVEMTKIIGNTGVLSEFNARKFLGLAGETLFGQHCCPIKTVRVSVPTKYIPALGEK